MATGSPARALLQPQGVVGPSNKDSGPLDLLEVTLQTQVRIPRGEKLGVNASVGNVARCAAFAQRLVFENVRTALGRMAAQASVVGGDQ